MALNAAVQAPQRIRRLVSLAPAASFQPFRPWVLAMLRVGPYLPSFTTPYTMKANFGGRYRPEDRLVDLATTASKHFRYQDRAVFPDVFADDELHGMPHPTLVMVGDKEMIYDPSEVLERASVLMPHATTELVANAGHLLNLEQAALVDRHVLDHLES